MRAAALTAAAGGPDGSRRKPACPDSAVADFIVHWDEVQPGDLVLHYGRLGVAEDTLPGLHGGDRVGVLIDGSWHCPKREDYTAVRRYVTADQVTPAPHIRGNRHAARRRAAVLRPVTREQVA